MYLFMLAQSLLDILVEAEVLRESVSSLAAPGGLGDASAPLTKLQR